LTMKLSTGKLLTDAEVLEVVQRELEHFNKVVKEHEKLLRAIGEL
jgi:hypothetical protein